MYPLKLWADEEINWREKEYDRDLHEQQRLSQGFSQYDFWSFDTFLAGVIANYANCALTDASSYPANLVDENEYRKILEKIRDGFANYAQHKFDGQFDADLYREAMSLFSKHFSDFWD